MLEFRTNSDLNTSVCEDLGSGLANEASAEQKCLLGGGSGGKLPELGLNSIH